MVTVSLRLLLVVLAAVLCNAPLAIAEPAGVDALLGNGGRAAHAARLAGYRVQGKTWPWETWSDWGRDLATVGFVNAPPSQEQTSEQISDHYACVTCHTTTLEGPDPSLADPDEAFAVAQQSGLGQRLTQGAGFVGMVNRHSYYGGLFAKYHGLCVPLEYGQAFTLPKVCWPEGRTMNPQSLEDAIQVCARYCGVGRYLEEWEVLALLTWFWDMELTIDDLALSAAHKREVLEAMAHPDANPDRTGVARGLVRASFLKTAPFSMHEMPVFTDGTPGEYPDGPRPQGDAGRGKDVYAASCLNCHSTQIMPMDGAQLVKDQEIFYKAIVHGGEHSTVRSILRIIPNLLGKPYMPEYARERLSRQQIEDIRSYLQTLAEAQ